MPIRLAHSARVSSDTAETQIYTWYEETVISDVRRALISKYGWSDKMADEALQSGGLRIYTCYDPRLLRRRG